MSDIIARFAKEHPEEARRLFNARIAIEQNPERIAELEVLREYLCNPAFRAALEEQA